MFMTLPNAYIALQSFPPRQPSLALPTMMHSETFLLLFSYFLRNFVDHHLHLGPTSDGQDALPLR